MGKVLRIALAGGGTGGHLYPAMNVLKVFEKRYVCRVLFFGTPRGIEADKVPQAGYNLKLLDVRGLQRRFTMENVLVPIRLLQAMRQSRRALLAFKPDILIGTGGYVMGPVLKQAAGMGIPYFLQEQNSFPGVTTRLLAAKARAVFVAYKDAALHLPDKSNIVHVGNPLNIPANRPAKPQARLAMGLDAEKQTWLVFGGSQGARNINRAMEKIMAHGVPENLQIVWQTGVKAYEQYKKYESENVKIRPFIDDMWQAYAAADFALCRAGAMSLSELAVAGLPAMLAPLKSAAGNHQYKNAKSFFKKGAAVILNDDADLAANIEATLKKWMSSPETLKAMGARMLELARPNAAGKIVDYIVNSLDLGIEEIQNPGKA